MKILSWELDIETLDQDTISLYLQTCLETKQKLFATVYYDLPLKY